jgi:transglycosylase-like protein with SLT domain/putative peptidoglycan binding protein
VRSSLCLLVVLIAAAVPATAMAGVNPQAAGLQVALRAYGLYAGPIDGIAGPATRRGVEQFQRRVGLRPDGVAGPATRRAFGPLGQPLFGRRTLVRGAFGWDVSVLQFLLARRGELVPVSGYFDGRTEHALRHFQRARHLAIDGIAGRRTLAAFRHRAPVAVHPVLVSAVTATPAAEVRGLLDYWAGHYGVDRQLVRALAWMESGFQTNLTSKAGAWGVMQILPPTWRYVETVLLGRKVPHTASGNIQVGVLFLRQLLREFNGNERLALAGWYQGPASVRKRGLLKETKVFVANVKVLERSSV